MGSSMGMEIWTSFHGFGMVWVRVWPELLPK